MLKSCRFYILDKLTKQKCEKSHLGIRQITIEGTKKVTLTGIKTATALGQVGHPDGQTFKNINGIEGLDVVVIAPTFHLCFINIFA